MKIRLSHGIIILGIMLMVIVTGFVAADRPANATPEIQGIVTGTGMNAQGTVTETDAVAWSLDTLKGANDPNSVTLLVDANETSENEGFTVWLTNKPQSSPGVYPPGSIIYMGPPGVTLSLLPGTYYYVNNALNGGPTVPDDDYRQVILLPGTNYVLTYSGTIPSNELPPDDVVLSDPTADPLLTHHVNGYNEQTVAVSGQTTYTKSMATSTGNKIADQWNKDYQKSVQFIAIDTGRMTSTEDILLDGSGESTNTSGAALCPFVTSLNPVSPAFCNIVQSGSAVDTSLMSLTTHAQDRFVASDFTIPTALNYNINAQGITVGSQSSPAIGSASAYLKVHVQEARNMSATKSEDLVYSETSTASGLITGFSKSMSYQGGISLI